ncbi:hypothetical protein BSP38_001 [Bacillus phage BSP38]|uniref:Uncharacterized protein n=1 Tax=Bacillus phage BSP38 TaxID=2283013 RepID=A0A345MJL1_BPBSP|nr:hypothetical protein HWB82_gp001 [Bacillus phage BSP38]AXH71043.1 hypothetical protein BSP38_001 [Bacillus phage BSP38]
MMNNEQSAEVLHVVVPREYAMVGGLYVEGLVTHRDNVTLTTDHMSAKLLYTTTEKEWLVENIPTVEFYRVQWQAQSVPITAEEMLGR